jgi:hypothetical protein
VIHCLANPYLIGRLVFALVSAGRVMMCPAIDNPSSYEIRVVIRFLRTKTMSAAEIRNELGAAVYLYCKIMMQNVLRLANRWSRLMAKWSAICNELSC